MDETPSTDRPSDPDADPDADPEAEHAARVLDDALSDAQSAGPARAAPTAAEVAALFPELEILGLLGQGGMGVVYKARQPGLDRIVALKILPRELSEDPAFAERFGREARTLARLDHPHIVRIHESGETDGLYYLVMEHVDGASLRQVLDGGRVAPAEALAIVPQICDALQYAHDQGVVHRDVKPENILLDERGRVKIADFGLAKLTEGDGKDPTLTGTRQVMGTWQYMAPEQYRTPQSVDHRADIFSLGVVFYEMLTGDLPIGRYANPSETAGLDERVDAIVMRTLERERDLRYQQAGEVRTDVERLDEPAIGEGPDTSVVPPAPRPLTAPRPGRTALVLAGIAIPLGILTAVVAYYFTRGALDQTLLDAVTAMGVASSLVWGFGLIVALLGGAAASRAGYGAKVWIAVGLLALLNGVGIAYIWAVAASSVRVDRERRDFARTLRDRPPRAPADGRTRRLLELTDGAPLPEVHGLKTLDEREELIELVLEAWKKWVDRTRDGDLPLATTKWRVRLYSEEDRKTLAASSPEEIEAEGRAGKLGLPLTSAARLGGAPHQFRVARIDLDRFERTARVTATKRYPPFDRTLVFPMRRNYNPFYPVGWVFAVGEVEFVPP